MLLHSQVGVAQNEPEAVTQVLVHVSTYQGNPFWNSGFLSHSQVVGPAPSRPCEDRRSCRLCQASRKEELPYRAKGRQRGVL